MSWPLDKRVPTSIDHVMKLYEISDIDIDHFYIQYGSPIYLSHSTNTSVHLLMQVENFYSALSLIIYLSLGLIYL